MASRTQTNRRSRSGRSSGARTRRSTRSGNRSSSRSRSGKSRSSRTSRGTARSRRPSAKQDRMLKEVMPATEEAEELILQALETELGGVQVYEAAVGVAVNDDLKKEWKKYLQQTKHHVEVVQQLIQKIGIEERETPGREVVRALGQALVGSIQAAQQAGGKPEHAEIVAAECVTLAETKDHLNWSLLGELAKTGFEWADAIQEACDEVEDEEDEHLYHTMGWTRELWIQGLGLPSALPPPEEERDVKSMAEAAKAKAQRSRFVEAES